MARILREDRYVVARFYLSEIDKGELEHFINDVAMEGYRYIDNCIVEGAIVVFLEKQAPSQLNSRG